MIVFVLELEIKYCVLLEQKPRTKPNLILDLVKYRSVASKAYFGNYVPIELLLLVL